MEEHPDIWQALREVIGEVRDRLPLFQAEHLWWDKRDAFGDPSRRFNAALASSINAVWLRVHRGSEKMAAGDYILAVNNTDQEHIYGFTLPLPISGHLPVFEEDRSLEIRDNFVQDTFEPYAVSVYGPFGRN